MDFKSIKAGRTKEVTLPVSGLVVKLKNLTPWDLLSIKPEGSSEIGLLGMSEKDALQVGRMVALSIVSCSEGTLTDKPPKDCTDNELSVFQLDAEDFKTLSETVAELSNGGPADAARFRGPSK
jgi:hypothetical protein